MPLRTLERGKFCGGERRNQRWSRAVNESSAPDVLVVGSAGTLGRVLCDRLGARGVDRRHPGPRIGERDAELETAAVVVNVGGPRVRPGLVWSDYLREHVGLASQVARSMPAGSHLVHMSSTAVYGAQRDGVIDGSTAEAPALSAIPSYAWAKLSGELAARAIAQERGVRITVVRFPDVYGPGVDSYLDTLLRYARRGLGLELGPGPMRRHMLHVALLGRAIERLILRGPVAGRPLLLADPFVLTNHDVNEALRVHRPRHASVRLPLHQASALLSKWPRFPGRDAPGTLSTLAALGQDNVFEWRDAFTTLDMDPADFARGRTFDPYMEGRV
jgi:nucleoside-diphosphate-sugar epimerase